MAGWLIPPQSLSGWLADSAAVAGWLNPPRARNAPPMSHLWTQTGIKLQVKNGSGGHKWLGCILGVGKAGRTTLDTNHHLQVVSKTFSANKRILCDRNVPVKGRLMYFDAVVTPVVVFGSRHRTIHQKTYIN